VEAFRDFIPNISYVSREVIDEAMQCSMLTIKKLGSGFTICQPPHYLNSLYKISISMY